MENIGIIERVYEPTDWVNPLVITQKKYGNKRICLDPTELKENILRQYNFIPSFDELCTLIHNAKVLDAERDFRQNKLSEKSSKYATFITLFGKFRFKVIIFNIISY